MKAQFFWINKDVAHNEKLAFIRYTLNGLSSEIGRHFHSHNKPQQ